MHRLCRRSGLRCRGSGRSLRRLGCSVSGRSCVGSGMLRFQILHKGKDLRIHGLLQNSSLHQNLANVHRFRNFAPVGLDLVLRNHLVVDKDLCHILISHRKSLRLNHQLAMAKKTPT